MCGIAGKLWLRSVDSVSNAEHLLGAMAGEMQHRGPDAQGVWLDPHAGIGLAHRRLSIVDLNPRAGQPMASPGGAFRVTFNGEIYNYREINAILERSGGHSFQTTSDTETLLHLYEEHRLAGFDRMLDRLRGMFAFGLWDSTERVLILVRDPLGKKPLYYAETTDGLVFASTVASLFQDPALSREIHPPAIRAYLSLGQVPAPLSAFAGVRKLQAGHYLIARAGRIERIERYWSLSVVPRFRAPAAELQREVLERLQEATRRRMVADVPLGVFLSGGVDSSAVVAMMARLSDRPVRTFSVAFHGSPNDESVHARAVAEYFGCEHTELDVEIRPEHLPEIVRCFEEPFADAAAIPTYFMSEAARRHVTVVLNGDGGDENFAGYELKHAMYSLADRWPMPAPARSVMRAMVNWLPMLRSEGDRLFRGRKMLSVVAETGWRRHLALTEYFSPRDLRDQSVWRGAGGSRDELLPVLGEIWEQARHFQGLDRELFFSFALHLPEQLLVKVDRATMAWSLEARSPLLDRDFVEFCARIPPKMKIQGLRGKQILRAALAGVLPVGILDRPKQGFNPPLDRWLRGPLRALIHDTLLAGNSFVATLLDAALIRRVAEEHLDGRRDHQRRLFALLYLELWERTMIRRQSW